MAWDPYDPHDVFRERDGHRLPEEPVKGRAAAAVFVGIVLLAIIFTIAANAQQATTQTGAGEQAQEQPQPPAVTGSTAPQADAQAPDQAAGARPLDGQIVEQPEGTRMTSELIGQPASTAEGEEMGKIADLLLTEDNRVAAAVIGVGGFLGFGERLIAVEIDRFQQVPAPEGGARLALTDRPEVADVAWLLDMVASDWLWALAAETAAPSATPSLQPRRSCPHTAIREDASINLAAVVDLRARFPGLDLILIESGGDNLAATFSPELADLTIYVIDVSAGDKIPRKDGPGITRSDLLVINKIDLALHVGASLGVMARDARAMRGERPFVLTNIRAGEGTAEVAAFIERMGGLAAPGA